VEELKDMNDNSNFSFNNTNTTSTRNVKKESSIMPKKYIDAAFKAKSINRDISLKQKIMIVSTVGIITFIITYLYFYKFWISLLYTALVLAFIPYIIYLSYKKNYKEYVYQQALNYVTNALIEYQKSKNVLESLKKTSLKTNLKDPIKSDVKLMVDLVCSDSMENAFNMMNDKYDFMIVKNLHQLFLQIIDDQNSDYTETVHNMIQSIDYENEQYNKDVVKRGQVHIRFIECEIIFYLLIVAVQIILGFNNYFITLKSIYMQLALHLIVILNALFLLIENVYYYENMEAE
jgi:hypothetical protein